MNTQELLIKTCQLECEYLNNPNPQTAKLYNKYRNELLRNKNIYKQVLKANIEGI
jgi:hypothetical protein